MILHELHKIYSYMYYNQDVPLPIHGIRYKKGGATVKDILIIANSYRGKCDQLSRLQSG